MPEAKALTRAGFARRYRVAKTTVNRALDLAVAAAAANPLAPQPPQPLNPGDRHPVYAVDEFDHFWKHRPRRGRPRSSTGPQPTTTHKGA